MAELSGPQRGAFIIGSVALVGCVIAGVIGFVKAGDAMKMGEVSAEPEEMTLAQLIARGPDGNPNVRVTDLDMDKYYVGWGKKDAAGQAESFQHVWIAARPRGEGPDVPVRVLVKNTQVKDREGVLAFAGTKYMKALVINKIDHPLPDEIKVLKAKYPGTDFDKVILLEKDRAPPSKYASVAAIICIAAGAVALVCALVGFLPMLVARKGRRRRRRRFDDDDDLEYDRPRRRGRYDV
jgi:hypothetical protein